MQRQKRNTFLIHESGETTAEKSISVPKVKRSLRRYIRKLESSLKFSFFIPASVTGHFGSVSDRCDDKGIVSIKHIVSRPVTAKSSQSVWIVDGGKVTII